MFGINSKLGEAPSVEQRADGRVALPINYFRRLTYVHITSGVVVKIIQMGCIKFGIESVIIEHIEYCLYYFT